MVLLDVVILRGLVGDAEGQADFQRLRRRLFPFENSDVRFDPHVVDENEVHYASAGPPQGGVKSNIWKPRSG
jgi:hypothetical protein